MSETMTRREFACVAVTGVAALMVGTSGCAADDATAQTEVDVRSNTFGGSDMTKRALVAYATRTGSTVGVAEAIGKALAERGFRADVRPVREHPDVSGYDVVVLGSAINGAAWLPEAMTFVRTHADALSGTPFAAFCVHSMNGGADAKQTRKRLAYLDEVREVLNPTDEGFFLGKGPDPEDTSLIARWAFKAFGGSGEGDMRDWDAICNWAAQIRV